jgi:hypothetical protein
LLLKTQPALKKEISDSKISSTANSLEHQRKGQKSHLSADEEALVIATAEIKDSTLRHFNIDVLLRS